MVLGVDGLDHAMVSKLMAQGRMPEFSRLAKQGHFQSLETSVPPLSPVAWSDFVTGLDSGDHGIYDFLHRDAHSHVPVFSMSAVVSERRTISLGSWEIPTGGGEIENQRRGQVFWEPLEESGVRSTIVRMPANYPPTGAAERELSGMGTPDINGTYGQFGFVSSRFGAAMESIDGGEIQEVFANTSGQLDAQIYGPPNPLRDPKIAQRLAVPMIIVPSPNGDGAQIQVGENTIALGVGRWSDWIPITFDMLPSIPLGVGDLPAMVRLYLRSVSPHVELYISPVNIDPESPVTPISEPNNFASELAGETGRFYTQGMPEDTKALEEGVLNREEFLAQAALSAEDTLAQMDLVVSQFLENSRSFLFYYIGHVDQVSHMLWKSTDPQHPTYDPVTDPQWAAYLESLYVDIDTRVGELSRALDSQAELIVMSDHGFASWRREFDLNGWLHTQGYLALKPGAKSSGEVFADVDWSRTRAYGLGFNGLYINKLGRERFGVVTDDDAPALMAEIMAALLAERDPTTDMAAISRVYDADRQYPNRVPGEGPDIVVGYAKGVRVSSESALGAVGAVGDFLKDRTGQWSGDHSMDHTTVPGILLTSFPPDTSVNTLRDLAGLINGRYDIGNAKTDSSHQR